MDIKAKIADLEQWLNASVHCAAESYEHTQCIAGEAELRRLRGIEAAAEALTAALCAIGRSSNLGDVAEVSRLASSLDAEAEEVRDARTAAALAKACDLAYRLVDAMAPRPTWVIGAPDPEMNEIEQVLLAAGEHVIYAMVAGARVHPRNMYKADEPAGAGPFRPVECDWPGEKLPAVDHHEEGDPGFGRPPAGYMAGSSLGQVLRLLGQEPSQHQRLIAAADHCLAAAYAGQCPGVIPAELAAFRVRQRAEWLAAGADDPRRIDARENVAATAGVAPAATIDSRGVDAWAEAIASAIEATRAILRAAPTVELDGVRVADLRAGGPYPELSEACTQEGVAALYRLGTKIGILGGGEGSIPGVAPVAAWLKQAKAGLAHDERVTGAYGDPVRGYAGATSTLGNASGAAIVGERARVLRFLDLCPTPSIADGYVIDMRSVTFGEGLAGADRLRCRDLLSGLPDLLRREGATAIFYQDSYGGRVRVDIVGDSRLVSAWAQAARTGSVLGDRVDIGTMNVSTHYASVLLDDTIRAETYHLGVDGDAWVTNQHTFGASAEAAAWLRAQAATTDTPRVDARRDFAEARVDEGISFDVVGQTWVQGSIVGPPGAFNAIAAALGILL